MVEASGNSFRAIVDRCATAIMVQREGRIAYVNRAASDCLGFACPSELLGQPIAELIDPCCYATLASNFTRVTPDDDQLFMGDLKLRHRTGALIDADVYHVGLRFDGADATMINFRDVTITKRMELELQQAQKLESIGRLAAGIAHEINTPIQFVGDSAHYLADAVAGLLALVEKSRAELLGQASEHRAELDRLTAEEEEADLEYTRTQAPRAIERILDGVARVSKIVAAMKNFSHPGTESPVAMDINRMLVDTLTVAAHEIKVAADVRTELGELPTIAGFPGELNQAFLNLVVNAAHAIVDRAAGEPGQITVSTTWDGQVVEVRIADNGCGMSPEVQARIFEPFFTTKEVGRGTGQGLTVVRAAVVQKHGGTIEVDSVAGQGTTIIIRLPTNTREPASE